MPPPGVESSVHVTCLGEALALVPALPGVEDPQAVVTGTLAGAEANVAVALSAMAVPAAWVGRLGDDALGHLLHRELEDRGVDVGAVQFDPGRPTGYYTKLVDADVDIDGAPKSQVVYRRAGSAASAMSPAFLDDPGVREILSRSSHIHTSGINAALSASSADLMRALLGRPRRFDATFSFDVNWREQLWPSGDPATVIELADLADIVFVGGDEAQRVLGTGAPEEVRALLPGPAQIIVKDGARRAVALGRDGTILEEPALTVEVVEPVGAGDAFAAGFLAGLARNEDMRRCLRRGHLSAAMVLIVPGDFAAVPFDRVEYLLDAAPDAWKRTVVTAAGVESSGLRN
jgi:2-dehydro-3-deoxygluconokinase